MDAMLVRVARQPRRIARAWVLSFALLASVYIGATPADAHKRTQRSHELSHPRVVGRAQLRRELRRDPRVALRPSFLRRAELDGLQVPVTMRLRPGATLSLAWDATRWPLDPAVQPPASSQQVPINGRAAMQIDFGAGTGYGGIGNIQVRSGLSLTLHMPGGLRIAEVGGCPTAPPAAVPAVRTGEVTAASGGPTWTDLNPFSTAADGTLNLSLSQSTALATDCTLPPPPAEGLIDPDGASRLPFVLRWNGSFSVSPAVMQDGTIRFGKVIVSDAAVPQPTSTGNIWACASLAALLTPPTGSATPCQDSTGAPVAGTTAIAFPAQVKIAFASADILLGDVP